MNNTAARVSGNEKEKRKKNHVSGERLRENALIVFSHKRYNV
jgi:hypothetical protein